MHQWTIVLLGASGDLARRKLLPALIKSIVRKQNPDFSCAIVCSALEDTSIEAILDQARPFMTKEEQQAIPTLRTYFSYMPVDFSQNDQVAELHSHVKKVERDHNLLGKRVVYCAIPPDHFAQVTQVVCRHNIVKKRSDHKIVYEKPFGSDLASARKINATIRECVDEEQVYRIDHYLTKELVNNIIVLRYANRIFEQAWSHEQVDCVEIYINESIGTEDRSFFDDVGTLKDVVQNHLLQLMALTAMERPKSMHPTEIAEKKSSGIKQCSGT